MSNDNATNCRSQGGPQFLALIDNCKGVLLYEKYKVRLKCLIKELMTLLSFIFFPSSIIQILWIDIVVPVFFFERQIVAIYRPIHYYWSNKSNEYIESEENQAEKKVFIGRNKSIHEEINDQNYQWRIGSYEDNITPPFSETEI